MRARDRSKPFGARRPGRRAAALCAALLLNACASSQPAPPGDAPAERLLAAPPEGFRTVSSQQRGLNRIAEFIPRRDDPEAWTEKVLFESFAMDLPPEPAAFLRRLVTAQREVCPELLAQQTFDGQENGYPTAVRLLFCPRHEIHGDGRVVMAKAMLGDDAFYVVVRERAVRTFAADQPPNDFSPDRMAEWSRYMRAIRLCNGMPEHPCPTAEDAAPPST